MNHFTLIDSDVLIDFNRGSAVAEAALVGLEREGGRLAISAISRMELLTGCRNKEEQQYLERFLRRFQMLELSEQISKIADGLLREYYLSHGLLIPDALIAATALHYDLRFLSKNQRDFRFISSLQLLAYPPAPSS